MAERSRWSDQLERQRAIVRGILWTRWDPNGARRDPNSTGAEYDRYVDRVLYLATTGATARQITEYLADAELNDFGYEDAEADSLTSIVEPLQDALDEVAVTPSTQLSTFLLEFSEEVHDTAWEIIVVLRRRLPGAVELVYDKADSLVVKFSPSERPSDAVFAVTVYPDSVSLSFLHGAELADPHKLLEGRGKRVRAMRVTGEASLDGPPARKLMDDAVARSNPPFDATLSNRIVVKSVTDKRLAWIR